MLILKALKNVYFGTFYSSLCMFLLKNFLLKRRRKIEKGAFCPNLKQGASTLCPLPAPAPLHNISPSCHVYGTIMSVFFPLHYFCLQKGTTNDSYMIANMSWGRFHCEIAWNNISSSNISSPYFMLNHDGNQALEVILKVWLWH